LTKKEEIRGPMHRLINVGQITHRDSVPGTKFRLNKQIALNLASGKRIRKSETRARIASIPVTGELKKGESVT